MPDDLKTMGLKQLLQHRAKLLHSSRELQQDAAGWRLLKSDEQKRVDELLDSAQACAAELERRRGEWSRNWTDGAALAEAQQRQHGVVYATSAF